MSVQVSGLRSPVRDFANVVASWLAAIADTVAGQAAEHAADTALGADHNLGLDIPAAEDTGELVGIVELVDKPVVADPASREEVVVPSLAVEVAENSLAADMLPHLRRLARWGLDSHQRWEVDIVGQPYYLCVFLPEGILHFAGDN